MHAATWSVLGLGFRVEDIRVGGARADVVEGERDGTDIRATLNGDANAYARLVARHQPQVFQQMWRFTRDGEVQDELVQEVFIEVYRSLPKFKGQAPLSHWICRIATRVGYRYWKREGRRRRREAAFRRQQVDPILEPEDLTASEAAECLHALLAQLPAAERLILTLTYFEGCDSTEIAERMGWNATLVRVRAHRARRALRQRLEQAGFGRQDYA